MCQEDAKRAMYTTFFFFLVRNGKIVTCPGLAGRVVVESGCFPKHCLSFLLPEGETHLHLQRGGSRQQ